MKKSKRLELDLEVIKAILNDAIANHRQFKAHAEKILTDYANKIKK